MVLMVWLFHPWIDRLQGELGRDETGGGAHFYRVDQILNAGFRSPQLLFLDNEINPTKLDRIFSGPRICTDIGS